MLAFGWIILIDVFDFRDYCAFDCVVLFCVGFSGCCCLTCLLLLG